MICKTCGNEFNIENFDMCPYCLTPVNQNETVEKDEIVSSEIDETEIITENVDLTNLPSTDVVLDDDDDYVVTEADLLDDEKETDSEEIPIDEIGLSVRAVNAFRRARIHTLNELIDFLAMNNVSDLKNVGAKTVRETEELIERIRSGELESIRVKPVNDEPEVSGPVFENISIDVDYLNIEALVELGLTHKAVSNLRKNNIKCCGELRFLTKKDFIQILGNRFLERLPSVATLLKQDIVTILSYVLDNTRESRDFKVFLRRAQGETLEEIAKNPKNPGEIAITRERVRQVEKSYSRTVKPFVREMFYILKGNNKYVSTQDLLDVFDDDEYDQVVLHVCKGFEEFEYLDFADMFVEKQECGSIEQYLYDLIKDIVGDGTDLNEVREEIDDILYENKLDYIGMDSIINLLNKKNYHLYGNFVVKGKSNYATVSMYVVKKYFPMGIKLSQSETEHTDDLLKLRDIIQQNYPGVILPTSDRALSSTLVRTGLILRGRGIYISQEHIIIDESLMEEIKRFIDLKDTNKVFYHEVYAEFEGVLNMMCGVDNYNYLHGILAMLYPNSYEFGRDYLLKNGINESEADSIADRIYAFICELGRPVSKSELINKFRGFSNVMIIMPFVNDSRLMQWEYNYYTCTGILEITEDDVYELKKHIFELFEENKGYASDGLLYDRIVKYRPEFIQKNHINSEMNLHYIVSKLFEKIIDFKRPHIGVHGKVDITSTKSVALYLLDNPEVFTFEQYDKMVEHMKWSRVTASAVLTDIEEDYDRVSSNEYIRKDIFSVSDDIVDMIERVIYNRMEDGILPLINFETDGLIDWKYSWNEFIIETIIKKYCDKLIVVQPITKDRRYQRGIIVNKNLELTSYAQIVAYKMKMAGCDSMTENQFLSFLVLHNLARKVIPGELSNSEYLKKDGDYYKLVQD